MAQLLWKTLNNSAFKKWGISSLVTTVALIKVLNVPRSCHILQDAILHCQTLKPIKTTKTLWIPQVQWLVTWKGHFSVSVLHWIFKWSRAKMFLSISKQATFVLTAGRFSLFAGFYWEPWLTRGWLLLSKAWHLHVKRFFLIRPYVTVLGKRQMWINIINFSLH